jgi:hypothetical protein
MTLCEFTSQEHKSPYLQGGLGDAFIKSKYDDGILTISVCQSILLNFINPLPKVTDLSFTSTTQRAKRLSFWVCTP